ncbi:phosphoserine phosphatase SerB [Ectothiorhodospiraceae bacterium 2226]|nr:phosphoserine phosphatase SerB [Ectothiorhodospiraceae bacterium 2226]
MNVLLLHTAELDAAARAALGAHLPGAEPERRAGHWRVHPGEPLSAERLAALREAVAFDVNPLPTDFEPARIRLLISDMDSTLITIECIDEIADHAGLKPQVAAVTAAAMRGELVFEESLRQRVALLEGIPQDALQAVYEQRLRLSPGAEALIDCVHAHGARFALVSGGFTFFTERLQARLGLDYTRANTLEIEHGYLTGRVLGEIVGAEAKAEFLNELCKQLGIAPEQSIAVGDGANDLLMLARAGLSVAYRAKPAVQAKAQVVLNHSGLEALCHILA